MAFQKTPSYLYRKAPGSPYYLKLPIPPALRHHFPDAKGKPRTHVVEALGTAKEAEAEQLKRPRLGHYWAAFKRLEAGQPLAPPSGPLERLEGYREAIAEARQYDDEGTAASALEDQAAAIAEHLTPHLGEQAAMQAYAVATAPGRLTLLEAFKQWGAGDAVKDGTQVKRTQAVNELLAFLRVKDCLPEFITETRAVAYVDWLNAGPLNHSTKSARLSTFAGLWKFLERRREVKRNSSPWLNHEITKKSTSGVTQLAPGKRGWKDAEIVALFTAPDRLAVTRSHYTRPLFRELYTLGLLTGMRLDEIVSLRPGHLEAIPGPQGERVGGYWLTVEASKTEAGVRTIPVIHRAAVGVLERRMGMDREARESLFPECRPGGPDNKLSWHVQKALGRDRDRLGFASDVDFHSTRRSFLTMMENSGADVVHVQRYVGHRINTIMHTVYSDGASRESLMKVAEVVRYSPTVEAVLAVR